MKTLIALNKLMAIWVIAALSLLLINGCAMGLGGLTKPEMKVAQAVLVPGLDAYGVEDSFLHHSPEFFTSDPEITSLVKLENISGRHLMRWDWYGPDKKLYFSSQAIPINTKKGRYIKTSTLWHRISIQGDKAENMPGDWRLQIYFDEREIFAQTFRLVRKGKSEIGEMPPMLSISTIEMSKNILEGGDSARLSVTLKNTGPGDARDVYLDFFTENEDISIGGDARVDTIAANGGTQTITVPVTGSKSLQNGEEKIDIQVVEPNFKIKIQGKRITFQTRKFRNPELVLARFSVIESASTNPNKKVDLYDMIDLKIAVQNIGAGPAEEVAVDVENVQKGVLYLGMMDNGKLKKNASTKHINRLEPGKYEIVHCRYFVNNELSADALKFTIRAKEQLNQYGFTEIKDVSINTELAPEGKIRKVAVADALLEKEVVIEEIPTFEVEVDVNIPKTGISNPDAVAVIIGNKNYMHKDIPEVQYAYNDAEIMREYLINTLGYNENNIIFKKDAVKSDFNEIFGIPGNHRGELENYIKPGRSDVFIYYSGHGGPDVNTRKGYFIPVDCKPAALSFNGYALDLFYENVSKLQAKGITIVMDACFSGGTSTGETLVSSASPIGIDVSNPVVAKGNAVCIASSKRDQISSWYHEKKHGLFTYFFLKALQGDADINKDQALTYDEIYRYVSDRHDGVPYMARRLYRGRVQIPTIQGTGIEKELVRY